MREGRTSAAGARVTFALLLTLPLAGCNDYLDRREGITATGGDAVRANIATHVANPWPAGAQDPNLVLRAERLVEIIERNKEAPPAPPPPRAPQSTMAK